MNETLLGKLYASAGIPLSSINARIGDAQMLTRVNHKNEVSRGGGIWFGNGEATSLPVIAKDSHEQKQLVKIMASDASYLQDADTSVFNLTSSGVPQALTTVWTSRMIEQLYKKMTLKLIAGDWQQGAPGVTDVKIPVMAFAGAADVYDDFSMNGKTSVNVNWVSRQIGYFEQVLNWGEMQQAQFGLAKIDYANRLREAMTISVSQQQNDIGFQGYTGVPNTDQPQLYGVLNEPNLNAAVTLPADGVIPGTLTPTISWMGKDFNQICRDIRLIIAQALAQCEGQINLNTKGVFGLPPSSFAALSTPNPISSQTVIEFLKGAYPNIEFVQIPNFEASMVVSGVTTNQTVGMLLFAHPNGEMPYDELFVTKWQGHRPMPMASAISEKISYGLGGVILKYPFLVVYTYGI